MVENSDKAYLEACWQAVRELRDLQSEKQYLLEKINNIDIKINERNNIIQNLVKLCPKEEREKIMSEYKEYYDSPIDFSRSGPTLRYTFSILKSYPSYSWSVPEIVQRLEESGFDADQKSVHNALNYLLERELVERVGRGRYSIGAQNTAEGTAQPAPPNPDRKHLKKS